MTRIPGANRALNLFDREEILGKTQAILDGLRRCDPIITKLARELLHHMAEHANEQELHGFWTAIIGLADRPIAIADRKEGIR